MFSIKLLKEYFGHFEVGKMGIVILSIVKKNIKKNVNLLFQEVKESI